jgi:CBS domain-containing protein
MALTVDEIMNRELLTLRPDEPVPWVIGYLMALGITAAPVVDEAGVPIGVVSLRDCVGRPPGATARDCMTTPVTTVLEHARVEVAARELVEKRRHRLVVVDVPGHAVGMVSAVDFVAALLGLPAAHPETLPHYDRGTGLIWADDTPLAMRHVEAAPEGPGLLLLVRGGVGERERVVWTEVTRSLRGRVLDLLSQPQPPTLRALLAQGGLRFRTAPVSSAAHARRALAVVADRANEEGDPDLGPSVA